MATTISTVVQFLIKTVGILHKEHDLVWINFNMAIRQIHSLWHSVLKPKRPKIFQIFLHLEVPRDQAMLIFQSKINK